MENQNKKLISLFELSIESQKENHLKDTEIRNLKAFRDHLLTNKQSHHHLPYSTRKQTVVKYRLIFFGLSAIFLVLSLLIHYKTQTNFTHFLFGTFSTFKTAVLSLSGLLSIAAFTVGYSLKTTKEIAKFHIKKANDQLHRIYRRKKIQFGVTDIFPVGQNRVIALKLKQIFNETHNKIEDISDQTLILLNQISESETLNLSKKEELLNQAILELKNKCDTIIHLFQNSDLSSIGKK